MSIWSGLFGRRNVKLSGRDDAATMAAALSAYGSSAGKSVTPDTTLQLATAWSCIRLLSETIGTLPLPVYRRQGSAKEAATVNGGRIPGHRGGVKAGQWRRGRAICKGPRSGPFAYRRVRF